MALTGVKAWCCKRLSDGNRTTSSVCMDNACRGSLITSASTDRQKTTRVNSCLPASMHGVLAFSMSYITIHAKLVLLLMNRQLAYDVGPIMTEERSIGEIWRSVQDSIPCATPVLTCMLSVSIYVVRASCGVLCKS